MKQNKRYNLSNYLQPAFLICVALLAISSAGMSIAIKKFGVYLKKEPWPLKKSLDILDEKQLGQYKVVEKEKIKNKEIVESLGTEDYIQWILEDTKAEVDSNVHRCLLFITYYALPDRVPHVPEECFAGTGYQKLTLEKLELTITKNGVEEHIPAKHLVFTGRKSNFWDKGGKFSVFYLFNVNRVYANSREATRLTLNKNIFRKYSYFSKVEWYFLDLESGGRAHMKTDEAISASQKLLGVILPILEKEHWPEWEN